ncbi:MAG: hypothetical protein E7358_01030 [Clostridiales bacterium]|nr:hypothetical protein [Clostridiales bacterium]
MKNSKPYNKINPFVYGVAKIASKFFCSFKLNLKLVKNEYAPNDGRKKVVICNHESFYDFMGILAYLKGSAHIVMSKTMLRTMPIKNLIIKAGVIEKNQFQTTVLDMRKMKAVLDDNKTLVIFPAGLMPEGGAGTPIPDATAKTLKWFDADVYVAKFRGTFLTKPKWSKVMRKGKPTLEIYKLASREELNELSVEHTLQLITSHLYFDAYKNNLLDGVKYKRGDNLLGIENVLYKCPYCGEEYSMKVVNLNQLTCKSCGYSVISDETGILKSNGAKPLVYSLVSDWHRFIEKSVYEKVASTPNFNVSTGADVYKINDKKRKFELAGRAIVSLDKEKFTLDGTLYNKPFFKEISATKTPILPSTPGKCFELQDDNDTYRICPDAPEKSIEWLLTLKAVYKLSKGK